MLQTFKSSPKPVEKPPRPTSKAESTAFGDLINVQLEIIADRLKYLEDFEEIVVHEKKQIEVQPVNQQYNKRLFQNRFKANLLRTSLGPQSSSHGFLAKSAIKNELNV